MTVLRFFSLMYLCMVFGPECLFGQWIPTNGPVEGIARALAMSVTGTGDTVIFVGADGGWVFRSTNRGDNWIEIDGGTWWKIPPDTGFMRGGEIRQLVSHANGSGGISLFALADDGLLFRSMNSDTNWTSLGGGIQNIRVWRLLLVDSTLFAATDSGIYQSTDFGSHWITNSNSLSGRRVYCLTDFMDSSNNANLLAGTTVGIYRSSTNGATWTPADTLARDCWRVVIGRAPGGDLRFYAIFNIDIFSSADSGSTWKPVSPLVPFTSYSVYCLAAHDTIIYAGTDAYGMYYSRDGGITWGPNTEGMGRRTIYDLLVVGQYLFAATASNVGVLNSVWLRPLQETITHVSGRSPDVIPRACTLDQNYPNPFNPTTKIRYEVGHEGEVSIRVYDVFGREVATLVNRRMEPGQYEIEWDAAGLASGVYFYKLVAGSYTTIAKALLLR